MVMKEINVSEGRRKEAVEEILKDIGVEGRIERIRKLKENVERGMVTIWVRLENEEQRKKMMEGKKKLKGRKEKITENLTWKERKMRWRLEQIAREEEKRDNRVWVGCGRIKINEQWWR